MPNLLTKCTIVPYGQSIQIIVRGLCLSMDIVYGKYKGFGGAVGSGALLRRHGTI